MSDPSRYRLSTSGDDSDHTPSASPWPMSRRKAGMVLGCVVAVLASVVWMVGLRPDGESVPRAESDQAVMATSIGAITWTRLDGDANSLPTSVRAGPLDRLVGIEVDQPGVWNSENGLRWDRSTDVEVRQDAGGVSWIRRDHGEGLRLSTVTATGEALVDLDAFALNVPDGFVVSSEIVEPGAGGIVWDVDGEVFVLLEQRMSRVDEASGEPPTRESQGTTTTQWLVWDGDGFVAGESPWTTEQVVDLAALDLGVLAAVTDPATRTVQLWRSSDGRAWERSALPAETVAGTPLPSLSDNGEATVTMYTDVGKRFWTTIDGETFDPSPDIPGIAHRSQGEPGWVAPDPRSSPRIRVSPDGVTWEEIDLREMLSVDSSYWDLTIDARIIDSTIFVTATRPEHRTMLIGKIEPQT